MGRRLANKYFPVLSLRSAPVRYTGASLGHFGLLAHAREKRTIPPVQTSLER